ncbi:MAG: lysophospholipid acyltransferase family protein [Candidatus Eisenbacteria bacterium]
MKPKHALEYALVRAAFGVAGAVGWPRALPLGAALGDLTRRLGIRVKVARDNLAQAFPELPEAAREEILRRTYREVGRIAIEYGQFARLANEPTDAVFERIVGVEHAQSLVGRGTVMFSGHYGNLELFAAHVARYNPVDLLVKPQSNPLVDKLIVKLRRQCGVGVIPTGGGVKQIFRSLRAGRWVAMAADQDARRHGVFVPFFGRLASTPEGPARISLQTGAPLLFGHVRRRPDGRHDVFLDPPREPRGPATDENVHELVAWYTSRLEEIIREQPEHWFWLHRRWKTAPPADAKET